MSSGIGVLAWRLGLGWLVGRRWSLVTTTVPDGSRRHSVVLSLFGDGNVYVRSGGRYAEDLAHTPRALVQAGPGPLGVRCRPPIPAEEAALPPGRWIVLEPTAEPVPDMVPTDLVWLWPLGVVVLAAVIARRRRG